ncbi:hypothetical protein [Parasitella parasitica]|uniref:DASH complex subunit DAM1 n=1 Tax=Parasitella parasitica TaxID=35722 RepID=A0A0B7NWF8_9FUNG|nr:hypothetical protein [Parasitella parasitica]
MSYHRRSITPSTTQLGGADNISQSSSSNAFDSLIPSIQKISNSFSDMHLQFEKIQRVNQSLVNFNNSFSAFLFGIAANDTTIRWEQAPSNADIIKHKEYIHRLNTLEATKAVQIVKQCTSTPSKTPQKKRPLLTHHGVPRKKPKIPNERPKQLVSNRRFHPKVDIKAIINRLPIKYQDRGPPNEHMTSVLKILALHPNGLNAKSLGSETKIAQRYITDCINTLMFRKEIIKVQEQGEYAKYSLDPSKFPSVPK